MDTSTLLLLIVACEIGFWVLLLSGLCARYLLDLRLLSSVLLICVPLIDLVLLTASVIDLQNGSTATFAHGLAAAYIGFTVAFGNATISWADRRFAYHFAGGDPLEKPPSHGRALPFYELKWWGRCAVAVFITICLSYAAILFIDDRVKTEALELWLILPLGTLALWFVFGPLWSLLFTGGRAHRMPLDEASGRITFHPKQLRSSRTMRLFDVHLSQARDLFRTNP